MKKAMLICATALGLGLAGPAMADDKTIGAVIGGTAGGAVGYQLGGEGGAAIGAILGAVIGAEVADEDDRRRGYDHRHYRNDNRYYGDHRHYDNRHVRRGPPPHAAAASEIASAATGRILRCTGPPKDANGMWQVGRCS